MGTARTVAGGSMIVSLASPLDHVRTLAGRLRRPEYTGDNRCLPCTVVNLVLAALCTAVLATGALSIAALFLVTSLLLIYFRGYLVPGTPTLTKRYLPERVLALFDHHPSPTAGDGESDLDLERILRRADAITSVADDEDVETTPDFHREWYRRMANLRDRDPDWTALAPVLGVDIDDVEFEEYGDALVLRRHGRRGGQWESRAAFVADVAGGELLAERSPDWDRLSVAERGAVLGGLRLFLDHCPTCGGPVSLETDTVESCCRSIDVVAISCQSCEDRLFEEPAEDVLN
ncbi:hypothetical protein [Haloarcula sp. JP-L23]|uniref:hypothetical protein n=1 Tax=Haloarcula sp. JP-L23 TaxID=2716717 RepID=UPI001D046176